MIDIHVGDCRTILASLPAASVQSVITSPPYFGLRDYGHADQIGLEDTPAAYVAGIVAVFRDVRRVLRDDGTVWLNIGDSYNSNPAGPNPGGFNKKQSDANAIPRQVGRGKGLGKVKTLGAKPKDLLMIPARVALALQADGWYLRSDTIWAKPNPMPESATDRPTSAHEHVFLLAKRPTYYYDADAIAEQGQDWSAGGPGTGILETQHYGAGNGGNGGLAKLAAKYKAGSQPLMRNIRNVWTIAAQPYAGAHFATMPRELARRCIAAGSSEMGACPHCGSPWAREVELIGKEKAGHSRGPKAMAIPDRPDLGAMQMQRNVFQRKGWKPSCKCPEHAPVPQMILDPFGGAGTTGMMANLMGRRAILIELNAEYAASAKARIKDAVQHGSPQSGRAFEGEWATSGLWGNRSS